MRFSCDRCGKRYATNDVPVPGRTYRLKCKACGNLILVKGEAASTAPDSPSAPSEHTDPAAASLEWSAAATPLADLVRPPPAPGPGEPPEGSAEPGPPPPASSPPPLTPAPTPAPAPSGARYVELFDERDLAEVTPTPTTGSRALGQGPPPLGAPPPLAAPADAALPPEGPPADDPFASVRAELEAAAAEERIAPAPPPGPSPERAAEPKGTPERPEFSPPARRRGPVLAFAVAGAAVVLVLVALAVWRPFSSGLARAPASAAPPAPAALPPPAAAEPKPAPAPAPPPKAAPEPPAPAAEPAKPPPESTAAPAPPPAEAPSAKPSPPPPPPRAPPPRKAEKQVRPAAKPPERTAAKAERREPVPSSAEPSPAAAAPAPSPEPEAREPEPQLPAGLSPEEVQRVVGTGRHAFDVCLREPSRGLDQPIGARQVTLRFTVEPEGRVSYPTIDDVTISGAPLGQCLKAAARGLSFPAFSGDPVKVDVPIAIPGK